MMEALFILCNYLLLLLTCKSHLILMLVIISHKQCKVGVIDQIVSNELNL